MFSGIQCSRTFRAIGNAGTDVSFRKERLNEWIIIGGLTVATYFTDDMTYTPAARFYHSSPEAKNMSDFCANIGDGTTQFALAGTLGAYGLVFKDQKALRTGSQIVQAVLASGAIIQVLKHVTGRESPFVQLLLRQEFGKYYPTKLIIIAECRNSMPFHPDIFVLLSLPLLWSQKIIRMKNGFVRLDMHLPQLLDLAC